MQTFLESQKKENCNGCGVCALKCPNNAITMTEDDEGFYYPVIDKNKCINCKICVKICPNKEIAINKKTKTYIAINRKKNELFDSASGGCFLPIAKYIISKNGVVFGVKYDKDLKVVHDFTDNEEELKFFQKSKYVRSDLNNSYEQVKEFLSQNKYVLFTGTPCQCQGLRSFLGKNYDKLFTCEIICHANPSPKIFNLYKKNLEIKNNKKIIDIKFRTKKNGWKNQKTIITYDDGSEEEDNVFYRGFIGELFNRPSCHNCFFCTPNRVSDFTIGDAWGIQKIDSDIKDDDTGISLLCINTEKGEKMLKFLSDAIFLKQTDTCLAFKYNHYENVPMHKSRNKFYQELSENTINETNIIKKIDEYTKISFIKRCTNKARYILKNIKIVVNK